jgi:hypothetical protein
MRKKNMFSPADIQLPQEPRPKLAFEWRGGALRVTDYSCLDSRILHENSLDVTYSPDMVVSTGFC